jgi:hypothetical protein
VKRNHRAVLATVFLSIVVALTGSLVLFLGSTAAEASDRPSVTAHKISANKGSAPKLTAQKLTGAKGLSPLSEVLAGDAWPGDGFGWSVSVSGSTAVVGAPYANAYTGAAYIFTKVGKTWMPAGELTASDAATGDEFGWSVSISGTTVAVGAPGHYFGIGSAYVFTDTGGTWSQLAELPDTDSGVGGAIKYGYSVLTTGSEIMVGADGYGGSTGAVYVFSNSSGSWAQTQKLMASDGTSPDMFGWSMALSGSTLVVSAVRHGANGAIYVFTETGGTWTQVDELEPTDGTGDMYFGDKVAISGSLIVAGAPGYNVEQGAAYVFSGSGATWSQTSVLTASDGQRNSCFGWSVGLSGKTVLIGAEETNAHAGAAYVFKKTGAKWHQKHEITAADGAAGDEFGYSASLSGTTAIVSADDSEAGAGSAYLYKL